MRFLKPSAYVAILALSAILVTMLFTAVPFLLLQRKPKPVTPQSLRAAFDAFKQKYPNEPEIFGLKLAKPSDALGSHMKLPPGCGLVVTDLDSSSPEVLAGVEKNDVLLAANDSIPLTKPEDLIAVVKDEPANSLRRLALIRHGKWLVIDAPHRKRKFASLVLHKPPTFRLGVTLGLVEPVLAAQLSLTDNPGILVIGVPEDGPAAKAGVKVQDILLTFGDEKLTNPEQLIELVKTNKERPVKIELIRAGQKQTIEITPELHVAVPAPSPPQPLTPQVESTEYVVGPGVVYRSSERNNPSEPFEPVNRPDAATVRKLDELSEQIKQLRSAVETLTREAREKKDAVSPKK
jgi:PDZ domain